MIERGGIKVSETAVFDGYDVCLFSRQRSGAPDLAANDIPEETLPTPRMQLFFMAATAVRRIVGEKRAAGEEILDFWALQRGLTEVDRGVSHSQLEVMIVGGGLGIRIPPLQISGGNDI